MRNLAGWDDDASAALIDRWRLADPPRKEIGEASETGEAHFHANVGDRVVAASEQQLGVIEAHLDAELVRRLSEKRFELANEVKRRNLDAACDVLDRQRLFSRFREQVAREAETAERIVREQHDTSVAP